MSDSVSDPGSGPVSRPAEENGPKRRKLRRRLGCAALAVAGVLAALVAAVAFLVATERGSTLVLRRLAGELPGEVAYDAFDGTLLGPLELRGLAYRRGELTVEVDRLELDWRPAALLAGTVDVERLATGEVRIALPPEEPGEDGGGLTDLELPIDVLLRRLDLGPVTVTRGGETVAELAGASGGVRAVAGTVSFRELHARGPGYDLRGEGEVTPRGDYPLDVELDWRLGAEDDDPWRGRGTLSGDLTALELDQRLSSPVAARVRGAVEEPMRRPRLRLTLSGEGVDPRAVDPSWPAATVSGTVELLGDPGSPTAEADLELVVPELGTASLGARLAAAGDERWRVERFLLRLPEQGELRVTGFLELGGEEPSVDLVARWQRLSWPLRGEPSVRTPEGRLAVRGPLSGYRFDGGAEVVAEGPGSLQLELAGGGDLEGLDLETLTAELPAGRLDGSGRFDWQPHVGWRLRLDGDGIDPSALAPEWPGSLRLAAVTSGRVGDGGVSGRLEVEELDGELRGRALSGRAAVEVDGDRVAVETLRLRSGENRLSVEGEVAERWRLDWRLRLPDPSALFPGAAGAVDARGEVTGSRTEPAVDARLELPSLAALEPLLPAGVEVRGGGADGTLDARLEDGELRARLELALRPGEIVGTAGSASSDDQLRLAFGAGEVSAAATAEGVRAELALPLGEAGRADAEVRLPGLRLPGGDLEEEELAGTVRARLEELAPLAVLLPELRQPRGTLDADLRLDGTVGRPVLLGELTLSDGGAGVPAYGLELEAVELRARSTGEPPLEVTGTARSGDGEVELRGELFSPGGPLLRLGVEGERFLALDTAEARVIASPRLDLELRDDRLELDGEVTIPEAQVELAEEAEVPVSDDVVVVGGEAPAAEPSLAVAGTVRLILGDDVRFEADAVTGRVTGELGITTGPGVPTTATGELVIHDGVYAAYGQKLTIDDGRLIYAGNPIDNPGLDVDVRREAADGTVATLEIRGTLTRPETRVYADSEMGQSQALSYLVLGRPLDEAGEGAEEQLLVNAATKLGLKGGKLLVEKLGARLGLDRATIETDGALDEAALVLGTYLSPDFYVSYGVGLFEAVNTLRVRYVIDRHWVLEAESGEGTGADVLYTVER